MADPAPRPNTASKGKAVLERVTFSAARSAEYFNLTTLQTMTGQPSNNFVGVLLKELLDNALDAAEKNSIPPQLEVRVRQRGEHIVLTVLDNGPGIEPETVKRILDFSTLTSDKAAYRSPTRGAQGNALKTVLGIPYALGSRKPVFVEARQVRHIIRASLLSGDHVHVARGEAAAPDRPGTRVTICLPADKYAGEAGLWVQAFALFNPHASVQIRQITNSGKHAQCGLSKTKKLYRPTVSFPGDDWRKYLPGDPISPHWFDKDALGKLLFSHVGQERNGGRSLTLRDFVKTFRGLSRSAKVKEVADQFPQLDRLTCFEANPEAVPALLLAMKAATSEPPVTALGLVGESHLYRRFEALYDIRRWWYKKASVVVDGIPYVFEVALAETKRPGRFFHGVNFSPTFEDPLSSTKLIGPEFVAYGVSSFLSNGHAHPQGDAGAAVAVAIHLSCPALEFLDKGKTRLKIPGAAAEMITDCLWRVVKDLYKEEERRRKDAARQGRADRNREVSGGKKKELKEAVFKVMAEGFAHASGNGAYPASSRFTYYPVRKLIQAYTTAELSYNYFSQNLVPRYKREVGPLDGLYYDPRGVLYEPHTGRAVPLGTREVESYQFPSWLYDKILYVEKKGVWPILQTAQLAERYDMAIIAGEGYATEACRALFSNAEKDRHYQLFVMHDADPYGYNIGRTLKEETARMPGHSVEVIDIGLHLGDALALSLDAEDFTRKKALPEGLDLNDQEREYFEGKATAWKEKKGQRVPKAWLCRRVELNALSAPQLVEYIEQKLDQAGVRGKVVPSDVALPGLTEGVYRDAVHSACTQALAKLVSVDEIVAGLVGALRGTMTLNDARKWIDDALTADPSLSWKDAVTRKIASLLGERSQEVEARIREALSQSGPPLPETKRLRT